MNPVQLNKRTDVFIYVFIAYRNISKETLAIKEDTFVKEI